MLVVGSVYMIDLYFITLISYISCIKVVNICHIKMYNGSLWIHADFLSHIRPAFQVEPQQLYSLHILYIHSKKNCVKKSP